MDHREAIPAPLCICWKIRNFIHTESGDIAAYVKCISMSEHFRSVWNLKWKTHEVSRLYDLNDLMRKGILTLEGVSAVNKEFVIQQNKHS